MQKELVLNLFIKYSQEWQAFGAVVQTPIGMPAFHIRVTAFKPQFLFRRLSPANAFADRVAGYELSTEGPATHVGNPDLILGFWL